VASLFTQVLEIAKDLDLLDLSTVYKDGTKIKANASKHHAYSYQRANEIRWCIPFIDKKFLAC
jgi:hypothetical protein